MITMWLTALRQNLGTNVLLKEYSTHQHVMYTDGKP